MKFINIVFFIMFFSLSSYGNRILFPNSQDSTILSSTWICQVLKFNYKNSCLSQDNILRRSIKVGFLDSGFNSGLPIFRSYPIQPTYSVFDDKNAIDSHGHGTQTVSVFIDTINKIESITGESIPFEIYPVKIHNQEGIESFNLIKGYFYLAHFINVDVINLSVSGLDYSIDEAKAFQYGTKNFKSVVVTASGNEAYNLDKVNAYPCSYQSPNMICVGGTTTSGVGLISNFGFDVDVLINGEKVRVVQREGNYNQVTGSSFSAPQITAYVTYALYKNPSLSYEDIKKMIINSSYDKSLCLFAKSCGLFSFSKFKILVESSLN